MRIRVCRTKARGWCRVHFKVRRSASEAEQHRGRVFFRVDEWAELQRALQHMQINYVIEEERAS